MSGAKSDKVLLVSSFAGRITLSDKDGDLVIPHGESEADASDVKRLRSQIDELAFTVRSSTGPVRTPLVQVRARA